MIKRKIVYDPGEVEVGINFYKGFLVKSIVFQDKISETYLSGIFNQSKKLLDELFGNFAM